MIKSFSAGLTCKLLNKGVDKGHDFKFKALQRVVAW
jgi:hypothetical protein